MSHHHAHDHSRQNLKVAFFLNLAFTIIEIIGGIYVNSIAIISDAVHDLGDSLSLGISWYLQIKSNKKPDKNFSFGYKRFSLLGALINCIVLIAGSVYVIYEAIQRIIEPEPSNAQGMMYFAIGGIIANGYAAWKLSSGKTLNEKVVSWHLVEDVLGWVAVLIVAIILQFKEILYLDPALSLLITIFILWNVIKRLRETLFIFLQGIPKNINKEEIEQKILGIQYIHTIYRTRIWSLDGEHHVFTTHVKLEKIDTLKQLTQVKEQIKKVMENYPLEHYTIETEIHEEITELSSGFEDK